MTKSSDITSHNLFCTHKKFSSLQHLTYTTRGYKKYDAVKVGTPFFVQDFLCPSKDLAFCCLIFEKYYVKQM